jgi:hypothetical protein
MPASLAFFKKGQCPVNETGLLDGFYCQAWLGCRGFKRNGAAADHHRSLDVSALVLMALVHTSACFQGLFQVGSGNDTMLCPTLVYWSKPASVTP